MPTEPIRMVRRTIINTVVALIAAIVPLAVPIGPAGADPSSDFLAQVNSLRASVASPALTSDPTLTTIAQQWAQHMASTTTVSHNPNLAAQVPAGWTKIGENVGDGSSVALVYNAMAASPPHHANMVDPAFNLTGVGIATATNGTVWITEDFEAAPAPPPPPPPATFIHPANGAAKVTTRWPFRWSKATAATNYRLVVGTSQGASDLFDTGVLPATQYAAAVPSLPAKRALWARIYTSNSGTWTNSDVTFPRHCTRDR